MTSKTIEGKKPWVRRRGMWGVLVVALGVGLGGCSYQSRYLYNECPLPDQQFLPTWEQWREARSKPGGCGTLEEGRFVCEALRREVERVIHACPTYVPGLMALAILAYEDRQFALAQQYLDALFSLEKTHGPAAVLRGRIALEEGNIPFALRFLSEQVILLPEDAELREVYAGALFFADKLAEARQQLTIASHLGAPMWRIAYHRGLFEELSGNWRQALEHYEEALRERPGWETALARRAAILATTRSHGETAEVAQGETFAPSPEAVLSPPKEERGND